MPIRIIRADNKMVVRLEGIILAREAADIKQAMKSIMREAAEEAVPVHVDNLLFMADEALEALIKDGRELLKGGDSIRIVEMPAEIRNFLIAHEVLPALPCDESISTANLAELKAEFSCGQNITVAIGEKNAEEYERLSAPLMRRQFKLIQLKTDSKVPEDGKKADGVILSLEFKAGLDSLGKLQKAGKKVMAILPKEDPTTKRSAELIGIHRVEIKPCPESVVLEFAKSLGKKDEPKPAAPAPASAAAATPAPVAAAASPAPVAAGPKRKVLIIDDSNLFRKQLVKFLGDEYSTLEAPNGEAALKLLESETPDVILLDIIMPELDGMETLQQIKDLPRLSSVPVIMLTAQHDREKVIQAVKLGAADFLGKPVTADVLRARLKKLFDKK